VKITVKIPKARDASISMEVDGVKGKACLKATLKLRQELVGASPLQRKPDFDEYVEESVPVCAGA